MSNDEGMSNKETRNAGSSSFGLRHSFVIRHWRFVIFSQAPHLQHVCGSMFQFRMREVVRATFGLRCRSPRRRGGSFFVVNSSNRASCAGVSVRVATLKISAPSDFALRALARKRLKLGVPLRS